MGEHLLIQDALMVECRDPRLHSRPTDDEKERKAAERKETGAVLSPRRKKIKRNLSIFFSTKRNSFGEEWMVSFETVFTSFLLPGASQK